MKKHPLFPISDWKWFGHAGHFIGGYACRFHLCTQVGPWLVSTVGELAWSTHAKGSPFEDVGYGRKFETMVFKAGKTCRAMDCNCGLPSLSPPTELAMRGYNTAGEATAGHLDLCHEFSRTAKVKRGAK